MKEKKQREKRLGVIPGYFFFSSAFSRRWSFSFLAFKYCRWHSFLVIVRIFVDFAYHVLCFTCELRRVLSSRCESSKFFFRLFPSRRAFSFSFFHSCALKRRSSPQVRSSSSTRVTLSFIHPLCMLRSIPSVPLRSDVFLFFCWFFWIFFPLYVIPSWMLSGLRLDDDVRSSRSSCW